METRAPETLRHPMPKPVPALGSRKNNIGRIAVKNGLRDGRKFFSSRAPPPPPAIVVLSRRHSQDNLKGGLQARPQALATQRT